MSSSHLGILFGYKVHKAKTPVSSCASHLLRQTNCLQFTKSAVREKLATQVTLIMFTAVSRILRSTCNTKLVLHISLLFTTILPILHAFKSNSIYMFFPLAIIHLSYTINTTQTFGECMRQHLIPPRSQSLLHLGFLLQTIILV